MSKLLNIVSSCVLLVLIGLALALIIPFGIIVGCYDIIRDEYKDEKARENRENDWTNQSERNR